MVDRYLVFDSTCAVCSRLAEGTRSITYGDLAAISIHDRAAQSLLDRAYPNGWGLAPYLVVVEGDKVRAWAGLHMAIRMVGLVGPRKAWRIWSLARRHGIIVPPGSIPRQAEGLPRRRLLRTLGALAVTAGLMSLRPVQRARADVYCPCLRCDWSLSLVYCRWTGACDGYHTCPPYANEDRAYVYHCFDPCGNVCDDGVGHVEYWCGDCLQCA